MFARVEPSHMDFYLYSLNTGLVYWINHRFTDLKIHRITGNA